MEDYNPAPDLLTLLDEENVEHVFEIIDAIETDSDRYVALVPHFDDPDAYLENDGELVILRVEPSGDDEEDVLVSIEDDNEYNSIADAFIKRLEEDYDIEQETD